jgi:regulator of protease activity HflC (stomatin/prohibitin superfamily)
MEQIVAGASPQVESRYITLDDLLIRRIILPPRIQEAIERKLEQQQLVQEYDFRLEAALKEAERREIEAHGIQAYNTIVDESLTEDILCWEGILATRELAASENAKIVVIGSGEDGLPIILGNP